MSICTENNVFATFFVVSGTLTSLSQEWAEHTNGSTTTGRRELHPFHHPWFLQCGKFFGQLFCLLLYGIVFGHCGGTSLPVHLQNPQPQNVQGSDNPPQNQQQTPQSPRQTFMQEDTTPSWSKFIFAWCALCDLAGTGLLYVGVQLTYKSSFIMLRGSVLFFTSLLSVAFLARNLHTQMWVGIGVSIVGMAVLGIRDYIFHLPSNKFDAYGIAAGDLLIVMAQIMIATRVVLEQKFVTKHNIHPLLAVGLEGLFGFLLNIVLLVGFQFVPAGAFSKLPSHYLEDSVDAFLQIKSTWQIALAFIGCVVSVAFYYYFGINFAKTHGAIARIVLDSLSSLLIWSVLFGLSWQTFHPIVILGYILVIVGVVLYSDICLPVVNLFRGRFLGQGFGLTPLPNNNGNVNGDTEPLISGRENGPAGRRGNQIL